MKIYVYWNNRTQDIVIKYSHRVIDIDIGSTNQYGYELLQIIIPSTSKCSYIKKIGQKLKRKYIKYNYVRNVKKLYLKAYKERIRDYK